MNDEYEREAPGKSYGNPEASEEGSEDHGVEGNGCAERPVVVSEGPEQADAFTGRPHAPNAFDSTIHLKPRGKGKRLVKKQELRTPTLSPEQRLLVLDVWKRSGLSAKDFAPLVGVSHHSLYTWKKLFEAYGPGGLMGQRRGGPKGSRLPEVTKRTILMIKETNPDYGSQRISDMLARGPGLGASPGSVLTVLKEAGYETQEEGTRPHAPVEHRFERATPGQLWQTDIFSFTLKRQNRRVYLVAFLDDHSRFITVFGLHASATTAFVIEALRAGIASYGKPEEVLTDNGPQYVTWRGTSAFRKELERQGIKHLVSRPRHPQTLGKLERFWGSLWRECLEQATFMDVEDARGRVSWYMSHYNFQRPHQGIGGLCPADRFFSAAPEVLRTLKARVAANALELARHGVPKKPFYLTGQVGGKGFSVHAEGERVVMTSHEGEREEIDLVKPDVTPQQHPRPEPVTACATCPRDGEPGSEPPPPPGVSPLEGGLERIAEAMAASNDEEETEAGDEE
jgi:transposase InsO family protein